MEVYLNILGVIILTAGAAFTLFALFLIVKALAKEFL